jgi:plastocyanin
MWRRSQRLQVAVLALAGAVACSAPPEKRQHVVTMRALQFAPPELEVQRGDTITWRNDDIVPHTSASRGPIWDSGNVPVDSSFSVVLDRAGAFDYVCGYHPGMTGRIVVR